MNSESTAQILNYLKVVLDYQCAQANIKWFISFGAMLYFIRGDKNLGKPFDQDLDISILGPLPKEDFIRCMSEYSFKLSKQIINDVTGEPLQMVFKPNRVEMGNLSIDVFFWVKNGDYWWHAYDYYMQRPKSGVPKKYVFKGTPESAMKGEPREYVWEEVAPPMNFPNQYGRLLDIWYPGWYIPDLRFGQSKSEKQIELQTCRDLRGKLV